MWRFAGFGHTYAVSAAAEAGLRFQAVVMAEAMERLRPVEVWREPVLERVHPRGGVVRVRPDLVLWPAECPPVVVEVKLTWRDRVLEQVAVYRAAVRALACEEPLMVVVARNVTPAAPGAAPAWELDQLAAGSVALWHCPTLVGDRRRWRNTIA